MEKSYQFRVVLGAIIIISLIITGVAVSRMQQNDTLVFNSTEYDVGSYPNYYWTSFVVESRVDLDAYMRVQFRCQGVSSTVDAWFTYMVFIGNTSVLYYYHDPNNYTVRWEMKEHGLSIKFSSSTNLAFTLSRDETPDLKLEPGEYAWVYFLDSISYITATSVSVSVSIVYK